MTILLTLSDFLTITSISASLNGDKKLLPYVGEAQQFDLKEVMGSAFYLDLVKDFEGSPQLQKYSDLWNGSEWICNGKTYRHEGLKTVLIYFSYSRYILNSSQQETAFGIVLKQEQNSEYVSEKTILRKADNAKSGAFAYMDDVIRFLNDNSTDYPLWISSYCETKKSRSTAIGVDPNDQRSLGRRYKRWQ